MNSCNLMGNLTRDIELKYAANGTAIAHGSLALNKSRKVNNEWVEQTSFVDFTAFGRQAETLATYGQKGDRLLLWDAEVRQESWEKDGQKRSKLVFIVNKMKFLNNKKAELNNEVDEQAVTASASSQKDNAEDIPF